MSESTLSITLADLRYKVAAFCSYGGEFGTAFSSLTAPQQAYVTDIIKDGLRQFYDPPIVEGDTVRHVWSFLRKVEWMQFEAASAPTDTVTVVLGVGTMTGGTLATWIAGSMVRFNGAGPYYRVASRDSSTQFTLEDLTVDEDAASVPVFYDHVKALPDDFGAIDGTITGADIDNLVQVSEERIRVLSSQGRTGTPEVFAFRTRTVAGAATTSTRREIVVYPFPVSAISLEYLYAVQLNALATDTHVPAGGMNHSLTIVASCLAIAASRDQTSEGVGRFRVEEAKFLRELAASVSFDRQHGGEGENLGYNGDSSDDGCQWYPRRARASLGTYTPGPYPS